VQKNAAKLLSSKGVPGGKKNGGTMARIWAKESQERKITIKGRQIKKI
jgi:hypothetical protein